MANQASTEIAHDPSATDRSARGKSPRVLFYIVLGVLIVAALVIARVMGMPSGVGVQHEPQESAPAPQ